jgi:hypothetical protein
MTQQIWKADASLYRLPFYRPQSDRKYRKPRLLLQVLGFLLQVDKLQQEHQTLEPT